MKRIGQYELLEVIGDGGMGTVYKARDPRFDRFVAVKVLYDHLAREPALLERFRNEAIIEAKLQHPNVVTVHDFVAEEDLIALVMEYVDGLSLGELITQRGGPLPIDSCLDLFSQMLSGIGYAHSQGLVHRDIKPSNIAVQEIAGRQIVKVMDFGVAKILGSEKLQTGTGAKMGTLWFSAPEQIRSPKDVDHRADIYSLGVTLYYLTTGKVPFDSESEYDLMKAVLTSVAPSPRNVNPKISTALDAVILKSLAKTPEARYKSCEEFQVALLGPTQPASAVTAPTPLPTPVPRPVPKPLPTPPPTTAQHEEEPAPETPDEPPMGRGKPRLTWQIVAIIAAVVALGGWFIGSQMRSEAPSGGPPSDVRPAVGTGDLVLRLEPAARASLDGWHDPQGGRRVATVQRFAQLEARTYRLKVWAEGYREDVRNVTVRAGRVTELEIRLDRQ